MTWAIEMREPLMQMVMWYHLILFNDEEKSDAVIAAYNTFLMTFCKMTVIVNIPIQLPLLRLLVTMMPRDLHWMISIKQILFFWF